jgi:hypothetical protein
MLQVMPVWDLISNLSNIAQIVGLVAAIPAVWIAWRQLRKAAKSAHGQFILALDAAFEPHLKIRRALPNLDVPGEEDDSSAARAIRNEVRRYIAVFERMGMLEQEGELDLKMIDKFYGDRMVMLLNNQGARGIVERKPREWSDFIHLYRELKAGPGKHRSWPNLKVDGTDDSPTSGAANVVEQSGPG